MRTYIAPRKKQNNCRDNRKKSLKEKRLYIKVHVAKRDQILNEEMKDFDIT